MYSKQTMKGGLHWWFDFEDKHFTMRLAGNPSLLLEEYRKLYGKEGDNKYLELLSMLKLVGERKKSPFVFYINNIKENEEMNDEANEKRNNANEEKKG